MKKSVILMMVLVIAMSALPVFAAGRGEAATGDGKIRVELITMDSIDEHWLKVRNGAETKAAELGNVELTFNAPQGKVDAQAQLDLVQNAITRQVDVIMLAPLNKDALVPGVEAAKAAGIKVIIIDSAVGTNNYDAFFFTDNGAAARLAADQLAKEIGGSGKVAIVNAQAGAGTTMTREDDFEDQIAKNYPGITVVGVQYSDGLKDRALNIATDFMTANPDLAGFYACNEGATVGTGNAIVQAGKAGTVKFVGFDWSADTKALMEGGALQAAMVQNPYQMGYLGVQAAADLMAGKTVQKDVDTGVTVATSANMNSIK
jgi:ribose transport system substrate-binding protein